MVRGKLLVIMLAALALVGCKATVETAVNLSDLLEGPSKALPGMVYVEVAGCNDYQDSRKPSTSLIESQKQIPHVFPDAEYVECFRQQMDSFASFKLPIYLDKDVDGKPASEQHINLASNDGVLLSVVVPKLIQDKLAESRKSMMGSSLDMNVAIKIKNDTGKEFAFAAVSAFVDGAPIVYSSMTGGKDAEFVVNLSDVSVQAAVTGPGAMVLFHDESGS